MARLRTIVLVILLGVSACSPGPDYLEAVDGPVDARGRPIPPPPVVPDGPLPEGVAADLDTVFADLSIGVNIPALERIGASGDARLGWLIADLLRFISLGPEHDAAIDAFEQLTGVTIAARFGFGPITDLMIAWDLPSPPGYLDWKRRPFELFEPKWSAFFDDADAGVDWRLLTWGGVLIDDRPADRVHEPCERSCIPALVDPAVTDAAGGSWYPDDGIVFGVVVNGAARAYPRNIMEVHELVNDTLGGRRIGIPYCTLCGSAQGYYTDDGPLGSIDLRTSGLLLRSNKVMFDLATYSMINTFTGQALTGPLAGAAFALEMITVVGSRWDDWKQAHPDTTIVAADGGIGREYPLDPLRGRDDTGPIFPIGDVDPRLAVQATVIGVTNPSGEPVAFALDEVRDALTQGGSVEFAGLRAVSDGAGVRIETLGGDPVVSHEAFWFAWSQFNPGTLVWPADR